MPEGPAAAATIRASCVVVRIGSLSRERTMAPAMRPAARSSP
jgi:hypothetical protein